MDGDLRFTPGLRIGNKTQFASPGDPRELAEETRILDADFEAQRLASHLIGGSYLNTSEKIRKGGLVGRRILIDQNHRALRQRGE